MFRHNRSVVDIDVETASFSIVSCLQDHSMGDIWQKSNMTCRLVYSGPPDYSTVDQNCTYMSSRIRKHVAAAGVTLDEAPVKTSGPIIILETFHAPLKVAYE